MTRAFLNKGFPGGSDSKESPCNAGNLGSIPGLGRSPGEGNGNPLQYSGLENPMGPGGLQSMGSQRVKHDFATKQQHITTTESNKTVNKQMAVSHLSWCSENLRGDRSHARLTMEGHYLLKLAISGLACSLCGVHLHTWLFKKYLFMYLFGCIGS